MGREISGIVGPQGVKLFDLVKWLKQVGEEDFLEASTHPFLLQVPLERDESEGGSEGPTARYDPPISGKTITITAPNILNLQRSKRVQDALIHFLAPREEGSKVTVIGRADECDVVLPERTVSKQHAELRPVVGNWQLVDLGSHNGTFVDGKPLEANAPTPIKGLQNVWFSCYRGVLLMPEQLFELGKNMGKK